MRINRTLSVASIVAVVMAATVYGISYVWPSYTWNMRLSSPGGAYDLVVLRQDAAAFSDFYYVLYIFPHNSTPKDNVKGERIFYTWPWRGEKYRIYSGPAYPMFRWLNDNTVEINLDEAFFQNISLYPVKIFAPSNDTVLVSLVFKNNGNIYTKP